jgi:hypothetical protein
MSFSRLMMSVAVLAPVLAVATSPAAAAGRTAKCSSILAICLQRAEGHASICEDMYRSALANNQWQATEEPDGTKHPPVPCTK